MHTPDLQTMSCIAGLSPLLTHGHWCRFFFDESTNGRLGRYWKDVTPITCRGDQQEEVNPVFVEFINTFSKHVSKQRIRRSYEWSAIEGCGVSTEIM